MVILARPVDAVTTDLIEIPINTVERGDAGSVEVLASADVPPVLVGRSCTVTGVAENQGSVHPGNDLIISSGGSEVVLEDVEAGEFLVIEASGELVLGFTVVVSLRFGEDEVFSGGLTVTIDCAGRIIVKKVVNDGDTTESFTFTPVGFGAGFSLKHGESNDSGRLDPGTYSVSETVPSGWQEPSVICESTDLEEDQSTYDAIDLQADETIICTFTNSQPPPEPDPVEVSIDDVCLYDPDDNPVADGVVRVTIDPSSGATVNIYDDAGMQSLVLTFNESGSDELALGTQYWWEIVVAEGYYLGEQSSTGSFTIRDCTPTTTTSTSTTTTTTEATTTTTSVLGTTITAPPSTLPFTGIESSEMVGIAIMLLGSGILLTMFGLGRREES